MQLWAEAVAVPGCPVCSRTDLQPGSVLVVWTAPPGPRVWEEGLRRVQPAQVYLFAVDPGLDALGAFLRRLVGLIKHALSAYDGCLEWGALAAAMAHSADTVQAGVRWLIARGQVSLMAREDNVVIIEGGGKRDEEAERTALHELEDLLRETAAYRTHFRQADARQLVSV